MINTKAKIKRMILKSKPAPPMILFVSMDMSSIQDVNITFIKIKINLKFQFYGIHSDKTEK